MNGKRVNAMKTQIILVCPAARCGEAAQTGLPVLRLGLGLDCRGTLIRTLAQTRRPGDFLGLSDFGVTEPVPAAVIRQLLDEAQGSGGIVADFERDHPALRAFLQNLDAACVDAGLPLFVPACRIDCAPNAWAIAPGAASGGCLRDELERGMRARHGRLAVAFEPTRRRFLLPADDPDGESLTEAELSALRQRTGAQAFFSRELCANYFTYMDGARGVFVLFDNPDTLQARLELIENAGVPYVFAVWEGCEALFNRP